MRALLIAIVALCPALVTASPAIEILNPNAVAASADATVELRIIENAVSKNRSGKTQVTRIVVEVTAVKGKKASAVPVGTRLVFNHQCSLDTTPVPDWKVGYPSSRCNTGWTAIPQPFAKPAGSTGSAHLVIPGDGTVRVAAQTRPATASLSGTIEAAKAKAP